MRLNKKSASILFCFLVIWMAFTILALTWGATYDWPDYVHVNYGFPMVWATHTLSTIAGAVNIWEVNITHLLIDLLFWLGLMVVVDVALTLRFVNEGA